MRKNILLMNLAVVLFWMSLYAYVATLPAYSMSLGADTILLGIIGGVYGIAPLILRVPVGVLSDKIGKPKAMLFAGGAVLLASAAIFVLIPGIYWVVIARTAAGAAGSWWVVLTATHSGYYAQKDQVRAQGVINASCNIGRLTVAVLGGLAAQFFGFQGPFFISLIAAGLFFILITMIKSEKQTTQKKSGGEMLAAFKNKNLIIFSLLAIGSQFVCFAGALLFTPVAAQKLGAGNFSLGMLSFTFFGAVCLASFFVGSRLFKKIGLVNVLSIGFLIGAFSCIPFFYSVKLPLLFGIQILSGISYGLVIPALQGLVMVASAEGQRGVSMGIFQSVYAGGIFLGPVLAGLVIDAYSFDAAYWMMAVLMAVSAMMCYALIPKKLWHSGF